MLPGEQTQECAHESSHMTSSHPRHNLASFTAGPAAMLAPRRCTMR